MVHVVSISILAVVTFQFGLCFRHESIADSGQVRVEVGVDVALVQQGKHAAKEPVLNHTLVTKVTNLWFWDESDNMLCQGRFPGKDLDFQEGIVKEMPEIITDTCQLVPEGSNFLVLQKGEKGGRDWFPDGAVFVIGRKPTDIESSKRLRQFFVDEGYPGHAKAMLEAMAAFTDVTATNFTDFTAENLAQIMYLWAIKSDSIDFKDGPGGPVYPEASMTNLIHDMPKGQGQKVMHRPPEFSLGDVSFKQQADNPNGDWVVVQVGYHRKGDVGWAGNGFWWHSSDHIYPFLGSGSFAGWHPSPVMI